MCLDRRLLKTFAHRLHAVVGSYSLIERLSIIQHMKSKTVEILRLERSSLLILFIAQKPLLHSAVDVGIVRIRSTIVSTGFPIDQNETY